MIIEFDSEEERIATGNFLEMDRSMIRLNKEDFDKPIFRVFPIERLIKLFKTKKNTLVKPSMWDDPFENFLFKQRPEVKHKKGIWDFETQRESCYGQCWTLTEKESDALWRIYSPKKDGVRVRTTIEKLYSGFYNLDWFDSSSKFYIGRIDYKAAEDIFSFFEDPEYLLEFLGPQNNWNGPAESLLIKRMEFEHENEVRLLYLASVEEYDITKSIFLYEIEPNELFDELLFDPRYIDRYFEADSQLFKSLGFTGKLHKSSLYQVPSLKLIV